MIDAQRQPAFDQHLTREVRSDATDSRTLARTPVFSVDTHIYLTISQILCTASNAATTSTFSTAHNGDGEEGGRRLLSRYPTLCWAMTRSKSPSILSDGIPQRLDSRVS